MRKRQRPRAVTVIAWIIIVLHTLGLLVALIALSDPSATRPQAAIGSEPELVALARGVLAGTLGIVSGIAMLLGLNWGRPLYLWSVSLSLVVTLALSGIEFHSSLPMTVFLYLVVLHYLRRSDALAFFQPNRERTVRLMGLI